jgi:WD40 repeat protein
MNDAARAVVFARDSTRVAAALRSAVRVWEVSSGRNVSDIEPPGFETRQGVEPVEQLAFSPDGKQIVGVSGRRPAVYVWDVQTRRLERTLTLGKFAGSFGSVVFNGDGSLLAAGSTGPIAIWRWRAGSLIGEIAKPPAGPIGPVTFLNDMKLAVNGPGKLELWDVSKRIPARDPDWQSPAEIADTAFVVRSGELLGIVSDTAWESDASRSGRIRLIAMPSGGTISSLEVPGRPTGSSKMP